MSHSPSGWQPAKWILSGVGVTLIVLGAVAIRWLPRLPSGAQFDPRRMIGYCATIAIGGGVLVAMLAFLRPRAALVLSFVTVIALVEFAGLCVLPAFDPYVSARSHEAFLRHDLRQDRLFTYHLPRSWNYGLAFYFGRELPEWSPSDPEPALVLTTRKSFNEIRELGRFRGDLDEEEVGILYVPIRSMPR